MFLINRKIQKLKIRRGFDSQRKLVIFEIGELVFTTDTKKLYIGDGISVGGILVSNRGYLIDTESLDVSNPPSYLNKNDILFNNKTNICYIVDQNEGSLFLRKISSSIDINSLSGLKISNNSISAAQLSWNSVKPNGGLALDPLNGLYIDYDSTQFGIVNGYLTILSTPNQNVTNYTFDTLSGAFSIDSNNSISVNVDNRTVKIKNNKLTGLGSGLSGVDTTTFQAFTANKDATVNWINFDGSVSQIPVTPGIDFRFVSLSGQNTFTIVSGNSFQSDFIGTVFRILNYNFGQNTNTIYSRTGLRVTSVSGVSAFGIVCGGTSTSNVNITGTGNSNGLTIQFEPRIRASKNIKWVKKNSVGDYTIFFDNPYDNENYSMSFGTKAMTINGEFEKQTTVHYSSVENPQPNKIRIESGYNRQYDYSSPNNFIYNDCSILNLIFKGKPKTSGANRLIDITLDTSNFIYNYVLNSDLIAQGWDGITPIDVTITVPSNVTIGSNATNLPAFTINSFPDGSNITLINYGKIVGRGGDGGAGGWATPLNRGNIYDPTRIKIGLPGSAGGSAISTSYYVTIVNSGIIGGGGGGGGGGGSGVNNYGQQNGQIGSPNGIGGSGGVGSANSYAAGGAGGDIGQNGSRGSAGSSGSTDSYYDSPGEGGSSGPYIIGNSNVTWITLGDVRGYAS